MLHFKNKNALPVLALAAAWTLAIALVNPLGDFPLNDDFSYARSTFNFLEQGRLIYDQWLSMTLVSQLLWGALFCKIFGASFTVLRFSTLVLAWVGLVASYFLCRELGQGRKLSCLIAAVVAFNPFFFSLSFTFMTDVPFFTFCVLSTFFYGKSLRTGAISWVLAGTFFALAATFVRQLGLMLPVSFGVAWLFREGFRHKSWLVALTPAALALVLFFLYTNWLEVTNGLSEGYGDVGRLFKRLGEPEFFGIAFYRTGILAVYLGAFSLPLSLALLPSVNRKTGSMKNWTTALAVVLLLVTTLAAWEKLPWGNLLYNLGLGPKLLKDSYFFLNIRPVLPAWVVEFLKITGFGGALLLFILIKSNLPPMFLKNLRKHPFVIFALANLVLYVGFLMLDMHFFDRYFFQMLPFLLVVALPPAGVFLKKRWLVAGATVLTFQAIFSLTATHDYLSWNRARWQALEFLEKEKNIPPNRIDGGFEYNGWHKPGQRNYESAKSWWWVDRDDFVVAFGDLNGFSKEMGFPFVRWLPPGQDSIYILKRV